MNIYPVIIMIYNKASLSVTLSCGRFLHLDIQFPWFYVIQQSVIRDYAY